LPGSSASVTTSGNSSALVLNFTIPQGAKRRQGGRRRNPIYVNLSLSLVRLSLLLGERYNL
jgi:hypothetical protein